MRTVLMAARAAGRDLEAEPVVVDTDKANVVVLELDDGERLELDRTELQAALRDAA